ncbi:filamentous hemagglutinin N-terminal domain-containing protein, partial [Burkholderia orbicola]|uniref:two-partner secretion domain-containing protein n=1 Tax=Burkholderia orbicola TaxID=2978683 RepID=UPI002FE23F9F
MLKRLISLILRVLVFGCVAGAADAVAVENGVVIQGNVEINKSSPNRTTINQSSERGIIGWSNFDIGGNESVVFNQPSSASATLNQIYSPDSTHIFGALKANGRIFIVNPNGVVFGQGASVDVGGLVVSSLGINNDDFMQGRLRFSDGAAQLGEVLVRPGAEITAKSFVALLGHSVKNEGNIAAGQDPIASNRGISLVAADAATIQMDGWNVQVDRESQEALVKNAGSLVLGQSRADGSIQLNAAGRNALMGVLLSNTGSIVNGSGGDGSAISLVSNGSVLHAGEINAKTGKIEIRGSDIALQGNVTVGTDEAMAPAIVEVGGALTNTVTQGLNSTISAKSQTTAQISISANKVLALSGYLLAPTGQISLTSTILDIGLLVPVSAENRFTGVPVWIRLPLKSAQGLYVYYGMDGRLYAENGVALDAATHLYDENGRDVGVVSDMSSGARQEGQFYSGGYIENNTRTTVAGLSVVATNLVVKRNGRWLQLFAVTNGNRWDVAETRFVDQNGASLTLGDPVSSVVQSGGSAIGLIFTGLVAAETQGLDSSFSLLFRNAAGQLFRFSGAGEAVKVEVGTTLFLRRSDVVLAGPRRIEGEVRLTIESDGSFSLIRSVDRPPLKKVSFSLLDEIGKYGVSGGDKFNAGRWGGALIKFGNEIYAPDKRSNKWERITALPPEIQKGFVRRGDARIEIEIVSVPGVGDVIIDKSRSVVLDWATGSEVSIGAKLGSAQLVVGYDRQQNDLVHAKSNGEKVSEGEVVSIDGKTISNFKGSSGYIIRQKMRDGDGSVVDEFHALDVRIDRAKDIDRREAEVEGLEARINAKVPPSDKEASASLDKNLIDIIAIIDDQEKIQKFINDEVKSKYPDIARTMNSRRYDDEPQARSDFNSLIRNIRNGEAIDDAIKKAPQDLQPGLNQHRGDF